jgi:hypothetical protein
MGTEDWLPPHEDAILIICKQRAFIQVFLADPIGADAKKLPLSLIQ